MAPLQDSILSSDGQMPHDLTPIQQFYYKKSVFMTGATGFLGKVIMEKLLRSCDMECIYVLIRAKKNDDIHTRLGKIFDDSLFDVVKEVDPKFRHKIVAINGDCMLPGLGINANDRALLAKNVNIVFHVAATVRFDEKLKIALGINVVGTREIINLAKEMESLKAFVHVSTAYAFCTQKDIEEKVYPTTITAENSIKLAESLDEEALEQLTPQMLDKWPNTYTYTKALAEDLVKNYGKGLPLTIFRPAIVIPTSREPVAGWIDNMYGPSGIVLGVAAGLLRVLYIDQHNKSELVPVDYCVNSLLSCAYDIANNSYEEPPVYNYVTAKNNTITWRQYTDLAMYYGKDFPPSNGIWYYTLTMTQNKFLVTILTFLYHTIPGALMDLGLIICGKKPKLLDTYTKIHKLCNVLAYFTNTKFNFSNNNVKNLYSKLDKRDKELFFFDMETIDWSTFLHGSMLGLRKHLMKEDPKNIPEARKRLKRLEILHYVTVNLIRILAVYAMYKIGSSLYSAILS